MFHVKHPLRAYRSWRHTRHVRRWRAFFEDKRFWDRMFAAAAPDGRTQAERVDTLASQLREALTRESR